MGADLYSVNATLFSHERYSIFEAMQSEPMRPVLVHKLGLYYSDNKKCLDQCLNQVREWSLWDHSYIPEIFDCWSTETELSFTTRRARGSSVAEVIERNQEIPPSTAFDLSIQAASALRYLHEQNEPHGRLELDSFIFEVDQWLTLTQPGWGVRLNRIVEEQNIGIVSGGEEERHTARLQDLVDWGVLAGTLFTMDLNFGYKSLGGQRIKEVSIDQSRSTMNNRGVPESMQRVILAAMRSRHSSGERLTSFEQLLGEMRDVKI